MIELERNTSVVVMDASKAGLHITLKTGINKRMNAHVAAVVADIMERVMRTRNCSTRADVGLGYRIV